jgi:2-methylfumaryl-CoA isomerase
MNHALLKGLRVVESSAFVAAPLAGLTLAQFGADVIRIDPIGGGIDYGRLPLMPGGRSLYWTGLNKSKRSLAVDLRNPQGRELIQELAAATGVLLTNIPTSWLSHAVLAKRRPDVITCTISGNADGSSAVDYTVNCATGYPAITGGGSPDAPVNNVVPAWDFACGYQAAFALLAAFESRRRTGDGAELKIALSDVAFCALSHLGLLTEVELLGRERESIGNHIYGAFGRDFGTADGHRIMIAAISAGQWAALLQACDAAGTMAELEASLGLSFRNEADRYAARDSIAIVIASWCGARPLAEITRVFNHHRVCWGLYRTVGDLLANDPRVSPAAEVFEQIETAGVGRHLAAGTPVRIGAQPRGPIRPAPLVGQHTDEVLQDVLGLDSAALGRLHDARIVAGPEQDPTSQRITGARAPGLDRSA